MTRITVHNPAGYPPQVVRRGLTSGLPTLDGKRVFLVDVGFENSDNFMLQLREWMRLHTPAVKTEVVRWRDQHAPDPELCERIKSEGDAAILGVGL